MRNKEKKAKPEKNGNHEKNWKECTNVPLYHLHFSFFI